MADHPLLFSAPMIRAILREIEKPGTGKTQTRRVLQPYEAAPSAKTVPADVVSFSRRDAKTGLMEGSPPSRIRITAGDRLWVRESILQSLASSQDPIGEYESFWSREKVEYLADTPPPVKRHLHPNRYNSAFMQSRPSIHMPRWASRLTLYVTDVRVERLQDISEADAIAEGLEPFGAGVAFVQLEDAAYYGTPRTCFARLWDAINGPGAWEANPWLVAYTFVPRLGNIDALSAQPAEAA